MKTRETNLYGFEEKESGKKNTLIYFGFGFGALIIILIAVGIYCYNEKDSKGKKTWFNLSSSEKEKVKTKYSTGAILDKILDVRTDVRSLVYLDISKEVFVIKNDKLWNKAQIGDSVKVGYIQDTTSFIHSLDFISMQTIGKAKSTKDGLSIISSDEPDRRTIIIPRGR